MRKGYWIPHIDVSDPEGYKAYMAATPPAHQIYNGVALVRGGQMEVAEGRARARNVLREFPDYAAALACYRSPEYQGARPMRLAHATSDFVIVEGYDGVQPPRPAAPPPARGPPRGRRAQGILDRACRCDGPGRVPGLYGRQRGAVRHVRSPLSGARRCARGGRRPLAQPHRGAGS